MDFMNLMNQLNGSSCGHSGCGHSGCGHSGGDFNSNCGNNFGFGSGVLPFLLLAGLGGYGNYNNNNGGHMTCYPNNQVQQSFIPPQSTFFDSGLKYKTKKVKQAYIEVPVSTYQVAQPMYGIGGPCQPPTTMNIIPTSENNNRGMDLCTLLLLLYLFNRNCHIPCPLRPQARNYSNEHSEL